MSSQRKGISYRKVHNIFRKTFETIQDLIIILLAVIIFLLALKVILRITFELSREIEFRAVISEILYVMIFAEIYRMIIVYLKEHRVAISFMAEIALVAALREVIIVGINEIHPLNLAVITLFILVLTLVIKVTKSEEEPEHEEREFIHKEVMRLLKGRKEEIKE